MVQRTPARVQAEQLGYRKSHFFFRFRQKSHAVDTRLAREDGEDATSGVELGADCDHAGDDALIDSRRNLPS